MTSCVVCGRHVDPDTTHHPELCPDHDVPPWHSYDGCYGCRRGNAIGQKALTT